MTALHAYPLPLPLDAQYWCTVGDAGNAADLNTDLGGVDAPYQIGKYEVTCIEYSNFLNATASKQDPHQLYHPEMGLITCNEVKLEDGTTLRTYATDYPYLPINSVSCYDGMRYCNWLQNGQPTTSAGDDVVAASTESGAYNFSNIDGNETVTFSDNMIYALPTENQWMKAAYYKGHGLNAGYWNYPTKSFFAPSTSRDFMGNQSNMANWNGGTGLTPVNQFPKTVSAYNVSDMAGNVAEWVIRTMPPEGALTAAARGGSFQSQYHYDYFCSGDLERTAMVKNIDPSTTLLTIGFRIVRLTPEVAAGASSTLSNLSEQASSLQAAAPSPEKTSILMKALRGLLFGILGAALAIVVALTIVALLEALGGAATLDVIATAVTKLVLGATGWASVIITPQALAWVIGGIVGLVAGICYGAH